MARCWPLLWVLCGLAWLAPPGLPAFLQAHSRRHRLKVSKSALKDAGRDKDALSESLTSRSELGKDSEQLLRSFPQLEEQCGPYVISSQAPVLVASTRNLSNEVLAELRNGQVVQIQELSRLEQRLRGRLKEESDDPRWISLKNTQTGFRWACPKGALDEIEGKLQKLEAQVKEEKERTSDLPGEEESEMDTLVDLLYLKALFAQTAAGLPPLSSFERSRLGTWAMFGRGLDNWNAVAGKQGFEVPLVVVSGQLRREILRSLDRKRYCQSLVGAYTQEQLRSPGQFQGFLEGFREAKNRVLKEIGGASGLPSLKSAPQTASAWTEQDFGKWIGVFRDVTTSTRCFQADLYFGHALFGLSLRRLCRRFELELSTQSFFTSEQTSESEEVLVERFKNFVEMLAKNQLLGEVLSLSPNLIAAIRRQTKAIFGKGLRDELQQPIERASKEIEENPDDVPPIAKHTSFLLEAAERGELRMLSVSLEGKERILMDALTFGVFLQDADDESVRRLIASDD